MNDVGRILAPIEAGLVAVEETMARRNNPGLDVLAGGKRLRPALLLFAARSDGAGPSVERDAVLLAATVEMVHTASLIHDDVIDESNERRKGAALHKVIGTRAAIILADYLFVQGLALLESVERTGLVPDVVREVRTMCEGQWLEMKVAAGTNCTERQYHEVIERKTAALFAFCCRAGGRLRGADAAELAALDEFGRNFGFVFQLLDDAEDMEKGKGEMANDSIGRLIARRGGRRYLRRTARGFGRRARTAARGVNDPVARRGMTRLLSFVMEV
jgi:octaprenyl-diphosphate synthase